MPKTHTYAFSTPILFFIFNRPEYTQQVFERIRQARPRQLFVVADGPRVPSDIPLIKRTRSLIAVDWECELKTLYADKNMGLKERISSGISWFFDHVERGIILEDDCLPHPSFFQFCEEMLEYYSNHNHIMMITGSNPLQDHVMDTSYTFSEYFSIWGWATWRRAWKQYDKHMTRWPEIKKQKYLETIYTNRDILHYVQSSCQDTYSGKTNTWDTQWFLTCLINHGLCIVPAQNLISNIGTQGVHTVGNNQHMPTYDLYHSKMVHPTQIVLDAIYDEKLYKRNFAHSASFTQKAYQYLHAYLVHKKIVKYLYARYVYLKKRIFGSGVLHNVNKTNHEKKSLLVYITDPYKDTKDNFRHQNYWQVREIGNILDEFGYDVDVIDHGNKKAKLNVAYDLVMDLHPGLTNAYNIKSDGKKVFYATGSDPVFSNKAELDRLNAVFLRKNTRLKQRRFIAPISPSEYASVDAMFLIGSTYNMHTFDQYTIPQVSLIKNTGYDFLQQHEYSQKSSNNFLFISGSGQVHKGLDMLLEIFKCNPDLHLYVCSSFASEGDFEKLYFEELYKTKNIHPIGIVNINSFEFLEICKKCSFVVSPSCSEGQSGSVLSAMSAGVIPITSKESGFESHETHYFPALDIDSIESTIKQFVARDLDWIKQESQRIMNITHTEHSKDAFRASLRRALQKLLYTQDAK